MVAFEPSEPAYYWRLRNTFLEFQAKPEDEEDSDGESKGSSCGRSQSVDTGIASMREHVPFVPSSKHPASPARMAVNRQDSMTGRMLAARLRCKARAASPVHDMQDSMRTLEPTNGSSLCLHHQERATCLESASSKEPAELITVMLRNIACKYNESHLEDILKEAGFGGQYTMVYVPRSPARARPSNLGYAFVTFSSASAVDECRRAFEGQSIGPSSTSKKCEVVLAHSQDYKPLSVSERVSKLQQNAN